MLIRNRIGMTTVVFATLGCTPRPPAGTAPGRPPHPGAELQSRAEFDLTCKSLTWTKIAGDTWGADGCGVRRTYVEVCGPWSTFGRTCHWQAQ